MIDYYFQVIAILLDLAELGTHESDLKIWAFQLQAAH
jgi:hypothetical protein